MLQNAKALEHYDLIARDGSIGNITDLYFDDQSWSVRYFVVDTGKWLPGRKVLLSPAAVIALDGAARAILVELTQDQVRNSPGIDMAEPVSRQQEKALHEHYGWPPYWGAGVPGLGGYPTPLSVGAIAPVAPPRTTEPLTTPASRRASEHDQGDPHLRSTREARGYGIAAADGKIGHLEDFLIHGQSWRIHYIVVDTRNWLPGRKVVVATAWISRLSWNEQAVFVDLTRNAIKQGPEYDHTRELSREYVDRLHEYYQKPHDGAW